jgi:hypothetical protein
MGAIGIVTKGQKCLVAIPGQDSRDYTKTAVLVISP